MIAAAAICIGREVPDTAGASALTSLTSTTPSTPPADWLDVLLDVADLLDGVDLSTSSITASSAGHMEPASPFLSRSGMTAERAERASSCVEGGNRSTGATSAGGARPPGGTPSLVRVMACLPAATGEAGWDPSAAPDVRPHTFPRRVAAPMWHPQPMLEHATPCWRGTACIRTAPVAAGGGVGAAAAAVMSQAAPAARVLGMLGLQSLQDEQAQQAQHGTLLEHSRACWQQAAGSANAGPYAELPAAGIAHPLPAGAAPAGASRVNHRPAQCYVQGCSAVLNAAAAGWGVEASADQGLVSKQAMAAQLQGVVAAEQVSVSAFIPGALQLSASRAALAARPQAAVLPMDAPRPSAPDAQAVAPATAGARQAPAAAAAAAASTAADAASAEAGALRAPWEEEAWSWSRYEDEDAEGSEFSLDSSDSLDCGGLLDALCASGWQGAPEASVPPQVVRCEKESFG
ncbi:hypothetical protein HYH03_014513 [Edaphochlamys debaryana]|uniref:Uncharacterized protein n=1 Tax=Edaphochlamys debaryana TaxID=47281 RepID=A0A835XTX1_9CHLO|nr:hypothetical protein HYH03_014513 [Edaphochlamys debaryana]|eukprot:KAG2486830.1 hypothetical protein HYH03_014513 [Edaphochlamys debaryana]